ncbi:MAG: hypothetical protein ACXABY_30810 [Candidatus Thorarchaeota archaeon]|jgi:hypothetical protein
MNDHLIPADIQAVVLEEGYHPVSFIPLAELWSVVGIRDGLHYNIQLHKSDLKVSSIHYLKYIWNASGAKILKVDRVLVERKVPVSGNI